MPLATLDTPPSTAEESKIRDAIQAGALQHVALIMDGNRRWAKENNKLSLKGHYHGYLAFKKIIDHALSLGLPCVTVYAFSTENWKRSSREVNYLMGLMRFVFKRETQKLMNDNVRFKILGDYTVFPESIVRFCDETIALTQNNTAMTLQVAINYGGRSELIQAIQKIGRACQEKTLSPGQITEDLVSQYLYTHEAPEPDFIIRTGGEQRTSNFLLWQSAYSELYFTPTYWPDFTPECFELALVDYLERSRRFGQ